MSLKDGASSRPPGSETIDDADWPRWDVLIRVVHRPTRSPSTVTTPISAMRFSAGLNPVVSTSTIARCVKGSKSRGLLVASLHGIYYRTNVR